VKKLVLAAGTVGLALTGGLVALVFGPDLVDEIVAAYDREAYPEWREG
jgi:hypothetical protein